MSKHKKKISKIISKVIGKTVDYALLVVAHPDDESIFFSGLLMNQRSMPWKVICITDGNADGANSKRADQFKKACGLLKVKSEQWDFKDHFESRLSIDQIITRLRGLQQPAVVYTHGILGEYGHPHHQDVSFAVHKAYYKKTAVWSVAYNAYPEKQIKLTWAQYKIKTTILAQIYQSETMRFLNFLPLTSGEGYLMTSFSEVEHIYSYFIGKAELKKSKLVIFLHLYNYLKERRSLLQNRPF